jgi:CRISPR/Cas system-associated endoribonuclease Cas2
MYCIVYWDIAEEKEEWQKQNDKMKACLASFRWAKPLYTLYLLKLTSVNQITDLHNRFDKVKNESPINIFYFMSPVFKSLGGFRGFLEGKHGRTWLEVNSIVKGDEAPLLPPIAAAPELPSIFGPRPAPGLFGTALKR